jgi:hypothetical protein
LHRPLEIDVLHAEHGRGLDPFLVPHDGHDARHLGVLDERLHRLE